MGRSLVLRDMVTEEELVSCRVTHTPMGKNCLRIGRVTYLARAQLLTDCTKIIIVNHKMFERGWLCTLQMQ